MLDPIFFLFAYCFILGSIGGAVGASLTLVAVRTFRGLVRK